MRLTALRSWKFSERPPYSNTGVTYLIQCGEKGRCDTMDVGRTMCDYISATAWDKKKFSRAVAVIRGMIPGEKTTESRLQYSGHRLGNAFMGAGKQKGRPHFMVQISGEDADKVWDNIVRAGMRPTRMDIQITIDKPKGYSARELCDAVRKGADGGRRLSAQLIENSDGNDTVYIGSRKSTKFVRLYVKFSDWIRFEVELKGEMARGAAEAAVGRPHGVLPNILIAEVGRTVPEPLKGHLIGLIGGEPNLVTGYKAVPELDARIRWLKTLLPTLGELANCHEYGGMVREWFHELSIESVED